MVKPEPLRAIALIIIEKAFKARRRAIRTFQPGNPDVNVAIREFREGMQGMWKLLAVRTALDIDTEPFNLLIEG